jgi:hypothetical protein
MVMYNVVVVSGVGGRDRACVYVCVCVSAVCQQWYSGGGKDGEKTLSEYHNPRYTHATHMLDIS